MVMAVPSWVLLFVIMTLLIIGQNSPIIAALFLGALSAVFLVGGLATSSGKKILQKIIEFFVEILFF